jgi:hypothetical protein
MRFTLLLTLVAALLTAAAASGTTSAPRIWLDGPRTVQGTGFPAGKVVVSVRGRTSALRVVRASPAGRFVARFETMIKTSGCPANASTVTAVGRGGVRAILKVPGNAKDCPPPPVEP